MLASVRNLPASLLLPALLGACSQDFLVSAKDDDPELVATLIGVEPRTIDFGRQTSEDVVTETITITNRGTSNLFVDEIRLKGDDSFALDLRAQELPFDLAPDETRTVDVVFTPREGGDLGGEVTIASDASNEPEVKVPFVGEGAVPELQITPNPMQLGNWFIPCATQQSFVITNLGFEPVQVTGLSLAGTADQLSFPAEVPLPFTLRQGQSQIVPVRFTPDFPEVLAGEFVVDSTDLVGQQRVPILGAAAYAATRTDTFTVQQTPQLDLIFAVDQSCSMSDQTAILAREFSTFTGILDAANVAWEVGVYTGGDDGCFVGGIISKSRYPADWASRFSSAVQNAAGSLVYTEALLQGVQKVVAQDSPGRCNAGFHVGKDPLQVVYVSDERDQSLNYGAPFYWRPYLASVQAYANLAPWKAHAIVDVNSACGDDPQGPFGYREGAQESGGLVLNVCTSWASQFSSIAQAALGDLGFFELSSNGADPDSLEVTVNGAPASTGWTYDASRNGIVFDDVPAGGTTITVTYGVAPSCGP